MDRYGVVTVHGEGETVYQVVDRLAPEEDQPAVVVSYTTRYGFGARRMAEQEAARLEGGAK